MSLGSAFKNQLGSCGHLPDQFDQMIHIFLIIHFCRAPQNLVIAQRQSAQDAVIFQMFEQHAARHLADRYEFMEEFAGIFQFELCFFT